MATSLIRLRVGKIQAQGTKYPSEQGFVRSINDQLKQLAQLYQSFITQMETATPEIMLDALQPTFQKTQERCPKKTGRLVQSGYLEITSRGDNPRVELGYAKGGNPPYAALVHENVEVYHKPPTSAKFVQGPMLEDLAAILARLELGYQQWMGSGSGMGL